MGCEDNKKQTLSRVSSFSSSMTPLSLRNWVEPILERAQERQVVYHRRDTTIRWFLWAAIVLQGCVGVATAGLSAMLKSHDGHITSTMLGATTAALSAVIAFIQNSGEPGNSRRAAQDVDSLTQDIKYFISDYECGAIDNNDCYKRVEQYRQTLKDIEERWATQQSSPAALSTPLGAIALPPPPPSPMPPKSVLVVTDFLKGFRKPREEGLPVPVMSACSTL